MTSRYSIGPALACCRGRARRHARNGRARPYGPAGTVTLSVADYDRLVDRATLGESGRTRRRCRRSWRAPSDARASRPTMARGTLRLEGEIFHRGAVKVPLVTGATLLEATADGVPLPLVHDGDVHSAVLSGPATFSLTLEWASPVSTAPGRAALALPSPAAGSVSTTIDLPGDPAEVRVDPGIVTRRQTAGGRTIVEATLEPGRRSQVAWSVRETATSATQTESRTLADLKSLVTIGEARSSDGDARRHQRDSRRAAQLRGAHSGRL